MSLLKGHYFGKISCYASGERVKTGNYIELITRAFINAL